MSSHRGLVFGRELTEKVPYFLEDGLERLEKCTRKGIFRLSGSKVDIDKNKKIIDAGEKVDVNELEWDTLSGLVKLYFREYPASLLSEEMINTKYVGEEGNQKLKEYLEKLPQPIQELWQYMCRTLHMIDKNREETSMDATNLALVMTPNIAKDTGKSSAVSNILEHFIIGFIYFWPNDNVFENKKVDKKRLEMKTRVVEKHLRRSKKRLSKVQLDGSGWIQIGSKGLGGKLSWRWVFVRGKLSELCYEIYGTETDEEPQKTISLGDYYMVNDDFESKNKLYSFTLTTPTATLYFAGANELERYRWVSFFKKGLKNLNNVYREGELKKKGKKLGLWKKRHWKFDLEKKIYAYKKGDNWMDPVSIENCKLKEVDKVTFLLDNYEDDEKRIFKCLHPEDCILWLHFLRDLN